MGIGILYFALFCTGGSLLIAAANDVTTYFRLQNEIKANEVLLEQTTQTQEELETTRRNLTNPDYLEFVARGKFHVSRYGEQVFVFPELDTDSAASDSTSAQSSQEESQSAEQSAQ